MTAQIRRSNGKPSPMGGEDALVCDRFNIQLELLAADESVRIPAGCTMDDQRTPYAMLHDAYAAG
jgi:hypothetical protein